MDTTRLIKPFAIIFVLLFLFYSYFAIYPVWKMNDWETLSTTIYQMLLLAAIVTPYAIAVVFLDGHEDDGADAH